MPLRPGEFKASRQDPFSSDTVERREQVVALCDLVLRETGPAIVAINGSFGTGKSAFVAMCAAHLRSKSCEVAEFNAWQHSHTGIPIIDIIASLSDQISSRTISRQILDGLANAASAIGERAVSKITRGLYELGDHRADQHPGLEDWKQAEAERARFRDALKEAASQSRLIILIDELDRCTPQAAIDTLDTIRHLLDVPGVIVMLGVNHDELRQRVQWVYGPSHEPAAFLRRFIDHTFDLAEAKHMHLASVAATALAPARPAGHATIPDGTLASFAAEFGLSLRDLQQLALRVTAILTQYPTDQGPQHSAHRAQARVEAITAICALRMAYPDLYRSFYTDATELIPATAQLLATNDYEISRSTVITLFSAAVRGDLKDPALVSAIETSRIPHPARFIDAVEAERKRLVLLEIPGRRPHEIMDISF